MCLFNRNILRPVCPQFFETLSGGPFLSFPNCSSRGWQHWAGSNCGVLNIPNATAKLGCAGMHSENFVVNPHFCHELLLSVRARQVLDSFLRHELGYTLASSEHKIVPWGFTPSRPPARSLLCAFSSGGLPKFLASAWPGKWTCSSAVKCAILCLKGSPSLFNFRHGMLSKLQDVISWQSVNGI